MQGVGWYGMVAHFGLLPKKDVLDPSLTPKTLPKALRTQALTALTSKFGLVCLVLWVWLGRFGFVGLVLFFSIIYLT